MNRINALSGRGPRFLAVAAVLLGSRLAAMAQSDARSASASVPGVPAGLDSHRGTLAMPGSGPVVGALLDDLYGGLRQKVLNLDSSSPTLLFPVLGKIPGWQSDVMLVNYQNSPQRIAFLFMQQGVNNASRAPLYYTLPANQLVYWHDFFATALGITGIGSIIVTGVDAFGNPDTAALLDGSARLYQTNSAGGTLSQLFPSVPLLDVPSGSRVSALGLRSDSHFRTNAGVVNPDGVSHTFTVSIVGAAVTTFQITVLPYSMMQVPIPNGGTYGDIALQFTSTSGSWWSAYGASVDNVSGDSWSAHGALAY